MDIPSLYDIYKQNPVICTDSRSIKPGCIFFALSGSHFNGNEFAMEALQKGASVAVVSDPSLEGKNIKLVHDTLSALQSLAIYHRRHFNKPFIGITGSNGKTTTKELITAVLSKKYKVHATVGNFNNHIGVPLTILGMPDDTDIAVIEMGANHLGEIKSLCEIAMPTHGIITNIGKAHLEGFGSVEGVQKAKGELFEYLNDHHGYAFVNVDDPAIVELGRYVIDKTTYGFNKSEKPANLFYYSSDEAQDGFTIQDEDQNLTIRSAMFGHYNATNMLAACTIGHHFNVESKLIAESLSSFVTGANRSETISFSGCTIVKDAYNANPSSMELALNAFAQRHKHGIVILGDMKELGSDSENAHQHILHLASGLGFREIILIGSEFRNALSKMNTASGQHFTTAESIELFKTQWHWEKYKGNAILLKGSRSMHLEKLLES